MAEQPTDVALVSELLETVAAGLGLAATVRVEDTEGQLVGTLDGEDLGLFIGRHGQTIDAVQHLAQRIVHARTGEMRRVVIDAEGYRARRQESLERQADQAAEDAIRNDRPVALDAMTASERRLVHEYLRERGGVDTHSEGDEPDRHLVVSPVPS
jgi:spoIIIJ-associated protein